MSHRGLNRTWGLNQQELSRSADGGSLRLSRGAAAIAGGGGGVGGGRHGIPGIHLNACVGHQDETDAWASARCGLLHVT